MHVFVNLYTYTLNMFRDVLKQRTITRTYYFRLIQSQFVFISMLLAMFDACKRKPCLIWGQ